MSSFSLGTMSLPVWRRLIHQVRGMVEPSRRDGRRQGVHGGVMRAVLEFYVHGGLAAASVDLDDINAS
ncbi:hypothetical protein RA280_26045 [Cupriavidus sp. CV2]|uniref:hypothetical protein n=1 Tax=Cupriavidus ulmosensis TaxID=3065913 RepID=UPI00296ABBAC|nr:hypothetical protein [Cupriavidus sp. CV2]MDW3685144.1 hypothetical protein [Cupriavidus sp. CV2]